MEKPRENREVVTTKDQVMPMLPGPDVRHATGGRVSQWHRRFRLCLSSQAEMPVPPGPSLPDPYLAAGRGGRARTRTDKEMGQARGVARDDQVWKNSGKITHSEFRWVIALPGPAWGTFGMSQAAG